jgi:hypothetical protein
MLEGRIRKLASRDQVIGIGWVVRMADPRCAIPFEHECDPLDLGRACFARQIGLHDDRSTATIVAWSMISSIEGRTPAEASLAAAEPAAPMSL